MNLTHKTVEVKETKFTLSELEYCTTAPLRVAMNRQLRREKLSLGLVVLSELIKKHRFEILGTHDGYRIITNGYGLFVRISTTGMIHCPFDMKAKEVFARLREIQSKEQTC